MNSPPRTDNRNPYYYGKPSDFRSALAISPNTLNDAREADATMALDGRADDYPDATTEASTSANDRFLGLLPRRTLRGYTDYAY